MGIKEVVLQKVVGRLVLFLINNISPQLREEIVAAVLRFEVKAKNTENEIDDIVVMLLKAILNIE